MIIDISFIRSVSIFVITIFLHTISVYYVLHLIVICTLSKKPLLFCKYNMYILRYLSLSQLTLVFCGFIYEYFIPYFLVSLISLFITLKSTSSIRSSKFNWPWSLTISWKLSFHLFANFLFADIYCPFTSNTFKFPCSCKFTVFLSTQSISFSPFFQHSFLCLSSKSIIHHLSLSILLLRHR